MQPAGEEAWSIDELARRLTELLQLVRKKDEQIVAQQHTITSLEATVTDLVQTTDQLCEAQQGAAGAEQHQDELAAALFRAQREHREVLAVEAAKTQERIDAAIEGALREQQAQHQEQEDEYRRTLVKAEQQHRLALNQASRRTCLVW